MGIMAHLPEVVADYLALRRLSPLKVLIRGPPGAGEHKLLGVKWVPVLQVTAKSLHGCRWA